MVQNTIMLIIISNPTLIANEASLINAMFDEGMNIFHLRKPGAVIDELSNLLEDIKPEYHDRIAIHQHHIMAKDFGLKRMHFTEVIRKEMQEEDLSQLKQSGHILSTSIHQLEEFKKLSACFSYTFFGPVFNSISKQGYTSAIANGFVFPLHYDAPQVIALGGITATNLQQAIKMKFDGIAVLGTIWQKPDESIHRFKAIQKAWKQTGQS